jgi:hypothetical protein
MPIGLGTIQKEGPPAIPNAGFGEEIPRKGRSTGSAVSQLVRTEAKELFVVFSQGKPPLAIFMRPQ